MRLAEPTKQIIYTLIGSTLSAILIWVVVEKIIKPSDKAVNGVV